MIGLALRELGAIRDIALPALVAMRGQHDVGPLEVTNCIYRLHHRLMIARQRVEALAATLHDATAASLHDELEQLATRANALSVDDPARRGTGPRAASLQRKAQTPALPAGAVHAIASDGVSGAGGPLPYLDTIQRAFGKHDVRHVESHTGSEAQRASRGIGARAYAMEHHVAFESTPDLHTAAHEAAHVVQQQKGVHLAGGVGAEGDVYERHADAVADKVVAGENAEALLDQMTGHGVASRAVQRDGGKQDVPAPPASGTRCFIDSDDGANLHADAAFDSPSITGPDGTPGPPLPAGKEVVLVGAAKDPTFWKISTDVNGVVMNGYVQAARVSELREDPMAALVTIPGGAQPLDLANKVFGHQVQDGLDLRFYANVLYWVNEARFHRGALTGSYFPNGSLQLVAGKRLWLVTPTYALAQTNNPAIPHGSWTGGAVAKVGRLKGELEDLTSSVRDAPNYFFEVAAEEAKVILDHLGEIIATTVAFILAEEASMVLAASGAGAPVALVIQMLLTLFGAAMVVKSVESAVQNGIAWFTQAWHANGDPEALHQASKSFLRMLIAIAVAVLAAMGTAKQADKTLTIASRIRRSVVSNGASEAADEAGQHASHGALGPTYGENWQDLANGPTIDKGAWKLKIGFSDGQPRPAHDTLGNIDPTQFLPPAPANGIDRSLFRRAGEALGENGRGYVLMSAPNNVQYVFLHFGPGGWSVPKTLLYQFAQDEVRIACCFPAQAKIALADLLQENGIPLDRALKWADDVIIGDWSVSTRYYLDFKDWTIWLGV